ncbi:MAG TPA: polysaccharide biosynthesis protein [Marinilabiliaceae bacterium]|nr:polysaccharide biosynthesis protein [Marinilabiliaceae bacterium]
MSLSIKRLAGETVIYGATTMVGRLLNWLLMPFYIRVIAPEEYGAIINIYSFISILLVVFTYGMETGFFRFSREKNSQDVYKTTLSILSISSLLLIVLSFSFANKISLYFYDGNYSVSIILVGVIVALDSLLSIPFAKLRLDNRPIKFGVIKLISIFCNIAFNIIFLVVIPYLIDKFSLAEGFVSAYNQGNGVFYVILSNLLSSLVSLFIFIPDFIRLKGSFSSYILKKMLRYSWPVLVVGITGMITQNADKILIPKLIKENGFVELAIYGANFKIGVLMSLFTQSFRFAFEPYFFNNREKGIDSYAKVMEYFVAFGLFIFLGITVFQDLVNILFTSEYLRGNIIIPYVLVAMLFYGIYFNLSVWYKLSDKTIFGAIFGVMGMIGTVGLDFILIPKMGIIGGAIAMLCGYSLMMISSYLVGQKHYYIPYNLKVIGLYFIIAVMIFYFNGIIVVESLFLKYLIKVFIFLAFPLFFVFYNRLKSKYA